MKKEIHKSVLDKIYNKVNAPLLFFDIETTGLDKSKDQIIQLFLMRYDGESVSESNFYFNSVTQSTPEAFNKHGLTSEFISQFPYFKDLAEQIYETYFTKGTVLCGFHSNNFDIPFIIEKFVECDILSSVSLLHNKRLDVREIYIQMFPNTLEGIYKRLVGETLENAHEARQDIIATISVLDKLLDIETDFDLLTENECLDIDGWFKRSPDGLIFNKGKYKGSNLFSMNKSDVVSYLEWIKRLDNTSKHTIAIVNKISTKLNTQTAHTTH